MTQNQIWTRSAIRGRLSGLYHFSDEVKQGIKGFDAITETQLKQFQQLGFLVIHDAFTPDTVRLAEAGLGKLILQPDDVNIMYDNSAAGRLHTMSSEQHAANFRRLMRFVDLEGRLATDVHDPGLLRLMSQLIGEQPDQAQDMAFFNLPAGTPVSGAWIAPDEATPENGYMMVIPGAN